MKFIQCGILVILAGFSAGCPARGTDEALEFCILPETAKVDFTTLKQQVLEPFQCIRCHSDLSTEAGVLKKVVPNKPEESPLFLEVADGSMPQSGPRLCTGYVGIVQKYIQGLVPEATPSPVPSVATYASIKSNILEVSCRGCHGLNGADPGRRKDLGKYNVFKDNIQEVLERMRMDDAEDDAMPPVRSKRPKPTAEMITIVQQWVDAGFPEN